MGPPGGPQQPGKAPRTWGGDSRVPGHRPCPSPRGVSHSWSTQSEPHVSANGQGQGTPCSAHWAPGPCRHPEGGPCHPHSQAPGQPGDPGRLGRRRAPPGASPGSGSAPCPSLSVRHHPSPLRPSPRLSSAPAPLSPASQWLTQPRFPNPQPRSPPSARLWADGQGCWPAYQKVSSGQGSRGRGRPGQGTRGRASLGR